MVSTRARRLTTLLWLGVALVATFIHATRHAAAQGQLVPTSRFEREHPTQWALLHGGFAAGGFVAAATIDALGGESASPCGAARSTYPDVDRSVEGYLSETAHGASNVTATLTIGLPVAAQFSDGFSREFSKALVVEGQAIAATLVVNTLVKELVGRPRPYTHNADALDLCKEKSASGEADVSFPSGHSANAFVGAMAGSLLYTARVDDIAARHVMWGVEFALAAATAELRVFAGRHYRSDVLVGSALGAAFGLLLPTLHGVGTPRVNASEWLTGVGAATGTVLALEGLHAWQPNLGLWKPNVIRTLPAATWRLAPRVGTLGVGLDVVGLW
jgi:membrane-associated phospholipid phosphatase